MLRVDATMLTNLKCCGKGSAQSADFIDAARRMVEASTAAPSLFLSGAAGDVNPVERGGGSAAANAMGKRLGAAIVTALLPTALLPTAPLPTALLPTASTPPQPKQQRLSPAAADSAKSRFDGWLADVKLSTHSITARVPLEALPTTATAAAFLEQQRDWLAATRAASDGASSGEGGGGGEGAGAVARAQEAVARAQAAAARAQAAAVGRTPASALRQAHRLAGLLACPWQPASTLSD